MFSIVFSNYWSWPTRHKLSFLVITLPWLMSLGLGSPPPGFGTCCRRQQGVCCRRQQGLCFLKFQFFENFDFWKIGSQRQNFGSSVNFFWKFRFFENFDFWKIGSQQQNFGSSINFSESFDFLKNSIFDKFVVSDKILVPASIFLKISIFWKFRFLKNW